MLHNHQRSPGEEEDGDNDAIEVRDIHALTPPQPQPARRTQSWEATSHRSSTLSEILSENFTTMSREFNAMVVAGSGLQTDPADSNNNNNNYNNNSSLARIGEDLEETNPLAIVPDSNPIASPRRAGSAASADGGGGVVVEEVALHMVKKEEVETKIVAWQTAEIAKINNRFKRQEVVINGWESEQIEKAASFFKKVERKLEEQRARAMEKMQNDAAKARRKAEEKRASSEAKRGTKVARVLELANLMKAVGRAPSKKSFF